VRQQKAPTRLLDEGQALPVDLDAATEADIREAVDLVRQNKKRLLLPLIPSKVSLAHIFSLFHCQRCGLCCSTGQETPEDLGIALLPGEHKRIARLLYITVKRLRRMCYRDNDGYYHLQYPCPFYDASKHACLIYRQRPFICRQFPVEGVNEQGQICMSSFCPGSREVVVQLLLAEQSCRYL
jgi:Fe-S-cluster containining protein